MGRAFHVVGAGLAGLSAAVSLVSRGHAVTLYEASEVAGGRCRSFHDHASGMTIDNGNHLILSGNSAALAFLRAVGAQDRLRWAQSAAFPFVDLASGARWTLDFGAGRLPGWLLDSARRPPGASIADCLALMRLMWRPRDLAVGARVRCAGAAYERLLRPFLTAALNVDPPEGSARLAAALLRRTIAAGGRACRPLLARDGLSDAFIAPALAFLARHGLEPRYGEQARALQFEDGRVGALTFGGRTIALGPDESVILAVPPQSAVALAPGLSAPTEFRAILNLHFRVPADAALPPITGIVGGLSEWIFSHPGRIAVTISNADALMDHERPPLAHAVWGEIQRALNLTDPLPVWAIVRERRATFAAVPAQEARRPGTRTRWRNLFLAGDWTATGLPATIEGAVASGQRAAALAAAA